MSNLQTINLNDFSDFYPTVEIYNEVVASSHKRQITMQIDISYNKITYIAFWSNYNRGWHTERFDHFVDAVNYLNTISIYETAD